MDNKKKTVRGIDRMRFISKSKRNEESERGQGSTATLLRIGFALLLAWVAYSQARESNEGELVVEIRDEKTRQTVPAMVCITSLADGKWRTPPDGRSVPPYSTAKDFFDPPIWKPGDIGPVRLTNGEHNNNDIRSFVYEGRSSLPFWKEPAAYFVSRPFTITLPKGRWRLAVARGIEYLPVFEEFEITSGQVKSRKVFLHRWVDMPARGWFSGDDHVHYPRTKPEHNEFLLTWAKAEDVHVLNLLRMGDLEKTYFEQSGYGRESRFQQDDYVLVSGQEDPRTELGHTIALNIRSPVRDTSQYHLYDFMFDQVHQQGGLTGYAHMAWRKLDERRNPGILLTWDPNINVVRGKIDFFEILQFRYLGLEDFYDFLNLGYRLTASAGSDVPWGNTLGEARVYGYSGSGRKFSADAWFAAMKRGTTFVTNGPMLELRVGSGLPGDELRVSRGSQVPISVRAWAPPEIGSPKLLEVMANGAVIRSEESKNPGASELRASFKIDLKTSVWIAARVTAHNSAVAHTSPIYVLVDGEGIRNLEEVQNLAEKRLKTLDKIESLLTDSSYTAKYAEGESRQLQDRIAEARKIYRRLLSKN
ncbi:MAG: hypothetical protein EXQ58_13100 [Acidobacteria bacterium]|nr:hypothetical protein [Acidobacteriota bacterium]